MANEMSFLTKTALFNLSILIRNGPGPADFAAGETHAEPDATLFTR